MKTMPTEIRIEVFPSPLRSRILCFEDLAPRRDRRGRRISYPSGRSGGRRIDRRHLADFLRFAGLRYDGELPMLYPHVFGFPLRMVVLMHPAFPIRPWRVLQIATISSAASIPDYMVRLIMYGPAAMAR